jgi:hypothetical protein
VGIAVIRSLILMVSQTTDFLAGLLGQSLYVVAREELIVSSTQNESGSELAMMKSTGSVPLRKASREPN